MRIIKNIHTMPGLRFNSDHRMCRGKIQIEKRIKYRNYRRKERITGRIIPSRRMDGAKGHIDERLKKIEEKANEYSVQEMYLSLIHISEPTRPY